MLRIINSWYRPTLSSAILMLFCSMALLLIPGLSHSANKPIQFQINNITLRFYQAGAILSLPLPGDVSAHNWQSRQIRPGLFHVRQPSWTGFWQIDLTSKTVLNIQNGEFGVAAATGERLNTLTVKETKAKFDIGVKEVIATIDQENNTFRLESNGAVLSESADWQLQCLTSNLCQFRHREWQPSAYWHYNLNEPSHMRIYYDDNFGKNVENRRVKDFINVKPVIGINQNNDKRPIPPDIAFAGTEPVKSAWLDAEKAIFRKVLETGKYDILVIPFQVSGYAVDRAGRSVMTRLLIDQLSESTSQKIAPPTVVAKALGTQLRTYDPFEVYQLANQLGVRKIIWCYAGHDLDLKLDVFLRIQEREQAPFSNATPEKIIEQLDIPFDDINPPEIAFQDALSGLTEKIGYPDSTRKKAKLSPEFERLGVPIGPADIFNKGGSVLARAYYLQLLGVLFPTQSIESEQLFERSLVLLRQLSPDSPDYALLKARALFYLKRRPAAVAALLNAKSAEARYLMEYLNGNLENALLAADKIKSTALHLMAEIELQDLSKSYSNESSFLKRIPESVTRNPQWKMLIERRLNQSDGWNLQDNIEVKMLMEELFPIPGFSSTDTAYSQAVVGRLDDEFAAATTPYFHYAKFIAKNPDRILAPESDGPTARDLLFLLNALGEENILKKVQMGFIQGRPEQVVATIGRLNGVFDGHPTIDYDKGSAIYQIASSKNEAEKQNLFKEVHALWKGSYFYAQGQTWVAQKTGKTYQAYYDYDFPRRSYWRIKKDPDGASDRKYEDNLGFVQNGDIAVTPFDRKEIANLELALDYAHTEFKLFQALYKKLMDISDNDQAKTALEKYGKRFLGHPEQAAFMATYYGGAGNRSLVNKTYENAIAQQPLSWPSYKKYFMHLAQQGDIDLAIKVARSFPPFSMSALELRTQNINRVGLSAQAYSIGNYLIYIGLNNEAHFFLNQSANYETGSDAEMWSRIMLATAEQDFSGAARVALANANRYNKASAYAGYMTFLYVLGFQKEADAVVTTLYRTKGGRKQSFPFILKLQMSGKSNADTLRWQLEQDKTEVDSTSAVEFYFRALATDRNIDKQFPEGLQRLKVWLQGEDKAPPAELAALIATLPVMDPYEFLGESFYLVHAGQFKEAYSVIKSNSLFLPTKLAQYPFLIPYGAWSATKSGHADELSMFLESYKKEAGEDFDFHLGMAFLAGGEGKHAESLKHLELARYNLTNSRGSRLVPIRYQLLEACEWLYESTGQEPYRTQLLDFASDFQQATRISSWAYSFSAKYARSPEERRRCLALTLYLDKQSARIANISNEEKEKASKWLQDNNPFLRPRDNSQKENHSL